MRPRIDRKNGDWSRAAGDGPAHRSQPLGDAVGGDHGEVDHAVVGLRIREHATPANSAPTFPASMQLAGPVNQGLSSTVILAVKGLVRKLFAPVHR